MSGFLIPEELKEPEPAKASVFPSPTPTQTFRTTLFALFITILALLVVSFPVYAHHGASMFDMVRLITVKGTVTSFEWVNPHSMIYADVKDEKGNVQKWVIETRGGPNALTRAGWTKDTVKPGDEVTFTGHPAKNGTNNMRLAKVVLASGKELEPEAHSWF
jgi:uncharacterized protein DUF6152